MQLRTKGYLILIAIVIFFEILMINLYVTAANEFVPYQLYDLLNFTRDNEFENGIGFLFGAIFFQLMVGGYLIYKDRQMIEH